MKSAEYRVWLAAAAAQVGQDEIARSAVAAVLKQQPYLTITKWLQLLRLPRAEDADRLADGMRKAGFPEFLHRRQPSHPSVHPSAAPSSISGVALPLLPRSQCG
jgi:hypothetical protein